MKPLLPLLVGLILFACPPVASAAEGSGNPVPRIALSTLCGAGAGLLLGGAMALVATGDNDDDIVKWSVVGGTFIGFGYGMYYAMKHPKSTALIELRGGSLLAHAALPAPRPGTGMSVWLLSATF